MIVQLSFNKKNYKADLSHALDISIPIYNGTDNPNCYWADPPKFETIINGDFMGSVEAGGSVNHKKITFSPHGNGTHTECYGHISADDKATINRCLTSFHFVSEVISISPQKLPNGDFTIGLGQVKEKIHYTNIDAIIIRTLPNGDLKKQKQYSGTNAPYIEASVATYLASRNINHLLIDLPSIDREEDGGQLVAHKAFWRHPQSIRKGCTITELIYLDNSIPDGLYLLNLQIAGFELDASPSKPVLYKLEEVL